MEVKAEIVENLKLRVESLEEENREIFTELKETKKEISHLETRMTVNERDIKSVFEQLLKIDQNTTWILRIIIGALVLGGLTIVFKLPIGVSH